MQLYENYYLEADSNQFIIMAEITKPKIDLKTRKETGNGFKA
ncbi:MAG: hypothetical protein Q4F95_02255 [Oscillospiraceae bacterium]|nr:hypothetical protein [Oscillospiraceae bacterium]